MTIHIAYSEKYQDWQLGVGHPTNPARAKIAVELLEELYPDDVAIYEPVTRSDEVYQFARLVHDDRYVRRVMQGVCDEWKDRNELLGETAALMLKGTQILVNQLLSKYAPGDVQVYFNPQGAKHHAQRDHSSGFCVYNDMAAAAEMIVRYGGRPFYLDWDAHHGDGVEALTADRQEIMTASIHNSTIFPGTGLESDPVRKVYNYPLPRGAGDGLLLKSVKDAIEMARLHKPDVILLACGADGLAGDPLGALAYTNDGIARAAALVGRFALELGVPVLIGGAGGYQPYDKTPLAWATTVGTIYQVVSGERPDAGAGKGLEGVA